MSSLKFEIYFVYDDLVNIVSDLPTLRQLKKTNGEGKRRADGRG